MTPCASSSSPRRPTRSSRECLPFDRSGCTSFQAIETIRALKPAIKILALECRCSSEQFSLAIKAGADGFLTRARRRPRTS